MADPEESGTATVQLDEVDKTIVKEDDERQPQGEALSPQQQRAVDTADKPDEVRAILSAASKETRQLRKQLRETTSELEERKNAEKTETERLTDEVKALRTENEALKGSAMRTAIAAEFGIPADQAHRLIGTDEDELRADAKSLAEVLSPKQEDETPPDLGGGPRAGGPATGSAAFSAQIRRSAGGH